MTISCKSWISQKNKYIYIHQNNDKSELHKYTKLIHDKYTK